MAFEPYFGQTKSLSLSRDQIRTDLFCDRTQLFFVFNQHLFHRRLLGVLERGKDNEGDDVQNREDDKEEHV